MSRPGAATTPFQTVPLRQADQFFAEPTAADIAVLPHRPGDRYAAGFALSNRAIEAALRLRYSVFNVEMGEGLAESALTGLDRDEFDEQMAHLVLLEAASGLVVGTYRMQTVQHGLAHGGIYSAVEFDLGPLTPLYGQMVELGRACLAPAHRNSAAIFGLWMGIGAFMNLFNQRHLFGCCSITSRDPDDGWRALKTLREKDYLHATYRVSAQPAFSCGAPERERAKDLGPALPLPKLFRIYMRLGTRVISEPALDTRFGTVDFLVLLDATNITLSRLDVLK